MVWSYAEKKMLIAGEWIDADQRIEVIDPATQEPVGSVPKGSADEAEKALASARRGKEKAAKLTVRERMDVLHAAADELKNSSEMFAACMSAEGVKTKAEAESEVRRAEETLRLAAEEARRLNGEMISFDQMPGNGDRHGYYFRFPLGIVAAITPFNDPLNLVAHKIAPAIAAGNAVILKPAAETPLSAIMLAEAFEKAGLEADILNVITGRGREVGDPIIESEDVRMITFTGGLGAGEAIAKKAGLKKLSMELGSNCPALVFSDADLDEAAQAICDGGYAAAGQNCIGVQRIYVDESVRDAFESRFVPLVKELKIGSKQSETTDVGPLINEEEAKRVERWVDEAVNAGAQLLAGGERSGAFYEPTILADVPPECTIINEEVFGPVVTLNTFKSESEAVKKANGVNYGLQAGVFTNDLNRAMRMVHQLYVGGVMVNDSSDFRVDAMPFGGVKGSGIGREGVKASVNDMTEPRVVGFKLKLEP
ncbi:glyceraldehyde-3-phosphate dehydrogenase (NADP+) [Salsuginibacillus halophilus]|uniref:Glyceraldehyde-3-phosphate dehydrogenase (NADP+) n=1 Tax=Salsuginibacillus halophilus TaxID=517424 RepID=A0A2P8HWK9_9BACI|nr:aldehyde dehydrogenase family protein [Salsuginibacillus halophilus]PSL50578.1 glyceraldehyde-3-phosphate dehydrogenase (NADP+) [Salsuginibacillus halophilus]